MDHEDLDQYNGQIINIEHRILRETRIIIHRRRYFTVRSSNNESSYPIILTPINVRKIISINPRLDSEPSEIEQTALEYVSSIKRKEELGPKVVIERVSIF